MKQARPRNNKRNVLLPAACLGSMLLGPILLGPVLLGSMLLAGCAGRSVDGPQPVASVEPGLKEFKSYCSACHQYDDQGMGEAPPLDHSPWVTGPEDRLIRIVLHGVRGPIEVHGKTYNREMPGFGQILSSAEIAAVLSFVRQRFGEPSAPVLATSVDRVRAASAGRTEYWSVEELLAEP